MELPDPERIRKMQKKRLEKVKEDQRRAIKNIIKPPNPKSCQFCKYYIRKNANSGYCTLWKREVMASDTCPRFTKVDHDDKRDHKQIQG